MTDFEQETKITISYADLRKILGRAIGMYEECGSYGMTPGGAQYMEEVMSLYPGYIEALGEDMNTFSLEEHGHPKIELGPSDLVED